MGLGTLTMLGMLMAPGQAPAAPTYLNQAKLEIPISYNPALKNEIQHLLLYGSRDEGKSWDQYDTADTSRDKFLFSAPKDGLYWLTMVIVDKKNGRDPQDLSKVTSPLKVFIDTRPPIVQIQSVERINDEVNVAWTVDEQNPDWSRFRIEYRKGDNYWTAVDAKGSATGSTRFRLADSGAISVRITAFDLAGNRTEETKNLAAAPNVVASRDGNNSGIQAARFQQPPGDLVMPPSGGIGVPPPPVPLGNTEVPAPIRMDNLGTKTAPSADMEFKNADPRGTTLPGSTGVISPPERSVPTQTQPQPARNELPSNAAAVNNANLPPLQVINVSRFDVLFDVENKGPSGVRRAEIYVTRDDGKSWQKWDVSEKGESPVTVDLGKRGNAQVEGIYGIKIVLLSGAGLSKGAPVPGDLPDMRVDVDLSQPAIKIYEPIPDPNQRDTMILRWQATDRNLASEPITLEWSETADGPWVPIITADRSDAAAVNTSNTGAKRLPNTGQYSWKLPPNFPTHSVYLRVTARDTAGNISEQKTLKPFLVDLNKPKPESRELAEPLRKSANANALSKTSCPKGRTFFFVNRHV